MAALSLVFDILARDNASKSFRDVGDAAEGSGKRIVGAMKVAAGAIAALGVAAFVEKSVASLARIERINAQTAATIKSTGAAAGVSTKHVEDLTGSIENFTASEAESVQQGANMLLTFTGIKNAAGANNDIFDQAVKLTNDMARAMDTTGGANLDLQSTAIRLGKALNDPLKGMTALSKVGVAFNAQQRESIKTMVESGDVLGAQKVILAELAKEFGGAGEAFAKTAAGKVELAKHALGTFGETITSFILPVLGDLASGAATAFNSMAEGFSSGEVTGDGFAGAMERVGVVLAGAFDAVGSIASVIGEVIKFFAALPGPVLAGVGALVAFNLLAGPVALAATGIGIAWLTMAERIAASTGVMGAARAAMGGLVGFLGGPWGIAIAGAAVAVTGIGYAMRRTEQQTKDWAQALADGGAAARQAIEDMQKAPGVLDRLGFALTHSGNSMGQIGTQTREARQALEDYRQSLDPVAEAQSRVTEWTNTLSDRLVDGKVTTEDARTAQERLAYWTDVLANRQSNLKDAVAGATATTQTFEQQTQDTRDALDEAKNATDSFKLSLDILSGANVSAIELESRFQAALDAADGALKNLSGSALNATGDLNLQSEAGRKAADVLLDVRNSGNDLIATMIQQEATTDQVAAKDAELRQSFLNTAAQMGITGQKAENLANKILGIPGERLTTITADTSQANVAIDNLVKKIQTAGGVHVATISGPAAGPGGTQTKYDVGGYTGDGGKYTPAGIVHKGEFVFPQESVKRLGVGFLGAMAGLPGYADGGLAGAYTIPVGLSSATLGALEKKLTPMGGGGPAGAGVQRWLPLVLASLNLVGQPGSLAQTVLRRMQQESGGNPRAINLWDSNAKRGTPSKGLMQVIDPTFRAYAMAGHAADIWDPLSNILASERYAMARYGSLSAAYNKAGGYAKGTDWVPETGSYVLHKGEAVVPAAANAGWTGGGPMQVTLQLDRAAVTDLLDGRIVTTVTAMTDRGDYNG